MKEQLKETATVQPVFASRKIEQELNVKEAKPPIVNEQCVVYNFQCDLCDVRYVGYTRGHLHNHVKGHKQQSSATAKHYKNRHRMIPRDLLKRFQVLKKCRNKFDCLVYEMLFIRTLIKAKSQHAIRLYSCESIFIIFAPCYVNFRATSLDSGGKFNFLRENTVMVDKVCELMRLFVLNVAECNLKPSLERFKTFGI